jgi:hypothetical protein
LFVRLFDVLAVELLSAAHSDQFFSVGWDADRWMLGGMMTVPVSLDKED